MLVHPLARSLSRPLVTLPLARVIDASFERFVDKVVAADPVRTPAIDVAESDAAYLVSFEVPGVAREQLKVTIEGRRVALESVALPAPAAAEPAATDAAAPAADAAPAPAAPRLLHRERGNARYARTIRLPAEVDQAASAAKFENGVLTLTLAKKVPTAATQLAIG